MERERQQLYQSAPPPHPVAALLQEIHCTQHSTLKPTYQFTAAPTIYAVAVPAPPAIILVYRDAFTHNNMNTHEHT